MLQAKPKPLGEVYDLLQRCGYPALPERGLAMSLMKQAINITLCDGDKLVAWVGVHGNEREVALDFACDKEYRRRWFTPSLYKALIHGQFARGVRVIKIETSQPSLIKAAIKAGFMMDDSKCSLTKESKCLHTKPVALQMEYKDYLRKYGMSGKSI
jgi:hypothetical protein